MQSTDPHAPREVTLPGADTVVLFLHGIMGSPNQFDELARLAAQQGVASVSVLLPGHGGSARAFARNGPTQWMAHALAQMDALAARYPRILLVGHSMGGLLAVEAALRYPKAVRGLFLLAFPLRLKLSLRSIRLSLSVALRHPNTEDPYMQAALRAHSIAPAPFWAYVSWLPNLLRLQGLARGTRKKLGQVRAPTVLLFSRYDECVAKSAAGLAQRGLPACECETLLQSSHFYYADADTQKLQARFTRFLQHIKKI